MGRAGLLLTAVLALAGTAAHAGQPGICNDVEWKATDADSMAVADVVVSARVLDTGRSGGELVLGGVETLHGPHSDRWELGYMGMPPHIPPRVGWGQRRIFGITSGRPGDPGRGMLLQFACRDNAVLPDSAEIRRQLTPLLEARK